MKKNGKQPIKYTATLSKLFPNCSTVAKDMPCNMMTKESQPWSKRRPKGEEFPVFLACFPSMLSKFYKKNMFEMFAIISIYHVNQMQKTKHQTKPKRHITFQLTRKQIHYNQVRDENTQQTNQSYLFIIRNLRKTLGMERNLIQPCSVLNLK